MQRIFQITLLTFLICLCISATVALGTFLYVRYGDAPSRISQVERRTEKLEGEVRKMWRTHTWTDWIGTQGQEPPSSFIELRTHRLKPDTEIVQTFDTCGTKVGGRIVAAWISDWSPRAEIAKLDELKIIVDKNGPIHIRAKPRKGESISLEFEVSAIYE